MREHITDLWVQRARQEGWRSRAAFKLMEIDDQEKLIRPGSVVVDLGAAPGGWSQVAAKRGGEVFALDLLDMQGLNGVRFIQGDFREEAVLRALENLLGEKRIELVLSDMAPNLSGIPLVDQARGMLLAELALEFARARLTPGGAFLVKVFQGGDYMPFLGAMRETFVRVASKKPKASRDRSAELYLLGQQLK
jgi:23S rRNA (uridine2552-2'-O)-methyltransferase